MMEKQIEAWIKNNLDLMNFWVRVAETKTWGLHNRTESEARALASYFEGRYDLAIEARQLKKLELANKE